MSRRRYESEFMNRELRNSFPERNDSKTARRSLLGMTAAGLAGSLVASSTDPQAHDTSATTATRRRFDGKVVLMKQFLREDFFNSLRWLFEGAVAWQAARSAPEHCRHQIVLAMHTSLLQARSLYEFYYAPGQRDDARASQFASGWRANQTALYRSYMSGGKPANKRLFHLVFERRRHTRWTGQNELKNRVLDFATDIKQITEDFAV